jgi:hypothetical protein
MKSKTIVCLSDCHVGSWYAVAPPSFTVNRGDETYQMKYNAIQKSLYKAWKECATEWNSPDILVINGEPIDGPNCREPSAVWSTRLQDQMEAAKILIRMYNAKKIYTTRGSDYHVTVEDQPFEEYFGKEIGATSVKGFYAPNELNLAVNGRIINFMHALPNTISWQYRSTAITREMAMIKLNRSHRYDADIIIRSHVHFFWYSGSTSHLAIITPCFKLTDWYAYKKGSASSAPDIGAVRLTINEDGSFYHEHKIFKFPAFKPPLVEVK